MSIGKPWTKNWWRLTYAGPWQKPFKKVVAVKQFTKETQSIGFYISRSLKEVSIFFHVSLYLSWFWVTVSCKQYFEDGFERDGVYRLYLDGPCKEPVTTICDQSRRFGGGWTLLVKLYFPIFINFDNLINAQIRTSVGDSLIRLRAALITSASAWEFLSPRKISGREHHKQMRGVQGVLHIIRARSATNFSLTHC